MGVHHFYLIMVPRSYLNDNPDLKSGLWSEAQVDLIQDVDNGCWAGRQPSQDTLSRIKRLLPVDTSWGDVDEFRSKHEWSSDVRIWKEEDGTVWSICFRFSPGADNISVLKQYLYIAHSADCLLYQRESGELLEPEFQPVFDSLQTSRAFRFLSDPKKVIVEAAEEIKNKNS